MPVTTLLRFLDSGFVVDGPLLSPSANMLVRASLEGRFLVAGQKEDSVFGLQFRLLFVCPYSVPDHSSWLTLTNVELLLLYQSSPFLQQHWSPLGGDEDATREVKKENHVDCAGTRGHCGRNLIADHVSSMLIDLTARMPIGSSVFHRMSRFRSVPSCPAFG